MQKSAKGLPAEPKTFGLNDHQLQNKPEPGVEEEPDVGEWPSIPIKPN